MAELQEIEREWSEEEERTLGMIVVVVRDNDHVLLLDAYGPLWNIVIQNGYSAQELLSDTLQPPSDGVWIAMGDFTFRACGSWECPNEDFDVVFVGEWRKPTPEEWKRLAVLESEFLWEKKDLPARRIVARAG